MSTLTVRNLDEDLKIRLRIRAAENGRSMEAEVREILAQVLLDDEDETETQGMRIIRALSGLRIDELELPSRNEFQRPIDFGDLDE